MKCTRLEESAPIPKIEITWLPDWKCVCVLLLLFFFHARANVLQDVLSVLNASSVCDWVEEKDVTAEGSIFNAFQLLFLGSYKQRAAAWEEVQASSSARLRRHSAQIWSVCVHDRKADTGFTVWARWRADQIMWFIFNNLKKKNSLLQPSELELYWKKIIQNKFFIFISFMSPKCSMLFLLLLAILCSTLLFLTDLF